MTTEPGAVVSDLGQAAWRSAVRTPVTAGSGGGYPRLDLTACPGLVVVAARPDDELLGLGGAIAALVDLGVEVRVVSVCDRDATLMLTGLPALDRQIPDQRFDQRVAAEILGVKELHHLGLPAGDLDRHAAGLADDLTELLVGPGLWCAAPWAGDGDPDSTVVARAAELAAHRAAARRLQYPVWSRHLPSAARPTLPWERVHTIDVPESAHDRKFSAVRWYIGSFRPDARPVLASVLLPQLAIGEIVFA